MAAAQAAAGAVVPRVSDPLQTFVFSAWASTVAFLQAHGFKTLAAGLLLVYVYSTFGPMVASWFQRPARHEVDPDYAAELEARRQAALLRRQDEYVATLDETVAANAARPQRRMDGSVKPNVGASSSTSSGFTHMGGSGGGGGGYRPRPRKAPGGGG